MSDDIEERLNEAELLIREMAKFAGTSRDVDIAFWKKCANYCNKYRLPDVWEATFDEHDDIEETPPTPAALKNCLYCDGTGRPDYCRYCKGTGAIYISEVGGSIECPECLNVKCEKCINE